MSNKNTVVTLALGAIALSTQAHADFLSDSKATLGMRNFYFNNDNRDGPAAPSKTEEWAQGFMLQGPPSSQRHQGRQGSEQPPSIPE